MKWKPTMQYLQNLIKWAFEIMNTKHKEGTGNSGFAPEITSSTSSNTSTVCTSASKYS